MATNPTKEHTSDHGRLVRQIDTALEELMKDSSAVAAVNLKMSSDLLSFADDKKADYTDVLRRVVLGDEQAGHDLENIVSVITAKRVKVLAASVDATIESIFSVIDSPLWTAERTPYMEAIERIQEKLLEIRSGSQQSLEQARELRSEFPRLAALVRRLEGDRRRVQVRLPLQIIAWGLPILLGAFVSGKFSGYPILLIAGSIFLISVVTFLVLRHSSRFSEGDSLRVQRALPAVVAVLTIVFMFIYMALPGMIVRSRMSLSIEKLPESTHEGASIEIPYMMNYDHESVAWDVVLLLRAPGLDIENYKIKHAAIGKIGLRGSFSAVVPADTLPGHYTIEIACAFKGTTPFGIGDYERVDLTVRETIEVRKAK